MSLLANALNSALEDLNWSQTYLAERSGIPRPQINRYARGVSSLERASLERIVAVIPPPHDRAILEAYLKDALPASLAAKVQFSISPSEVKKPLEWFEELDPELRSTLKEVAHLAARHTEIRDLLIGFVRALHR